ncbi:MAG TPA: AzlC family ABC transporter permease [Firmicutes bacterium]|nr:AzlC family ABC transporter permease [Bacillota bacterium]
MSSQALRRGFLDAVPLGIGVTIYGLVYGMMARQAAIPLWVVLGMSLIVFAGSSQMIAVEMIASGAGPLSTMLTVLIVNLRHVVMAADLSRFLPEADGKRRALTAFFLTDESYSVSYSHFQKDAAGGARYVLGAGLNIYLFWGLSGVLGYLGGNLIPPVLEPAFGFAMAAAFLSMLVPIVRDRPTLAAVLTSAVTAVAGNLWLPGKWYILLAAFAGSGVGFLLERRLLKRTERGAAE